MTCDSISKLIPLYYYGELTPEEEDQLDEHLAECAGCAREIERQRTLAAALDRRVLEPPALLLEDCRADLMAAIAGGAPRAEKRSKGPWKLFLEAMGETLTSLNRMRQPIGAVALVAIGFFAARFTGMNGSNAGITPAGNDVFATVRSVQPDSAGNVKIALDETRRREISGRMDDPGIQRYLVAAAREENPAVRVESVGLLQGRSASADVREILLSAVRDPVVGVRLKALEGLRSLAGDPEVLNTLSQVLLTDDSDAVRMQVVDLLSPAAHRNDSVIGVLQNAVQREDNSGVRLKCQRVLKELNASVGTF
jgi:hypothetical protein